jgi:hypothetical protein
METPVGKQAFGRGWENNIKMDLRETGFEDEVHRLPGSGFVLPVLKQRVSDVFCWDTVWM